MSYQFLGGPPLGGAVLAATAIDHHVFDDQRFTIRANLCCYFDDTVRCLNIQVERLTNF
jgi:hypothetical protein